MYLVTVVTIKISAKGAEETVSAPFLARLSSKLGQPGSMNSSSLLHNTRGGISSNIVEVLARAVSFSLSAALNLALAASCCTLAAPNSAVLVRTAAMSSVDHSAAVQKD